MKHGKSFIYQINTWVWLNSLEKRFGQPITLHTIPEEVLGELSRLNVGYIWLMGIWQRSPAARASALNYVHEYRPVLPDMTEDDIIGSAYAVGDYTVDHRLGGREGLAAFRQRLSERGIRLILDFVPNHVATDHPWVTQHPEYMLRGSRETLTKHPGLFFETHTPDGRPLVVGHGRDPYFPSWIDTAQLNALSPDYRRAARDTLLDIASQCDGVRCDMAMLMLNEVFARTWGTFLAGTVPQTEYWDEVIPAVKEQYPDFLFIAEVYWGMEQNLIDHGFDFTYDKVFYDRALEGRVAKMRDHLLAPVAFQERQIRFLENHDEPRIAGAAGVDKSRPLAVLLCTTPGVVLLHDGQLVGRKVKLPVQIRRQPDEALNPALATFYYRLLAETNASVYRKGKWELLTMQAVYEGSDAHQNLLAYSWRSGDQLRLIVVNMTAHWSHGWINPGDWPTLPDGKWALYEVLSRSYHFYDGERLMEEGLYVELEAYQAVIFRFERFNNETFAGLTTTVTTAAEA
jgi:glycosidase